MNLDTGVAVNTCPLNFGPDGAGDERLYRTKWLESISQRKTHVCTQSSSQCVRDCMQKDIKNSIWDLTVVSWFLYKAKLARQ